MTTKADMKIDGSGYAMVEVELDRLGGITFSTELTSLEAENLIKQLRAAVTRTQNHNLHRKRMNP